ncbi:hypothetical protein EF903_08440 [Streptomyces sp. WAC05292]|nr:hypothetical protein EF903_08440 [Streptomyces sp. WAC05292]
MAHAYLREAANGTGLHRRLADLFELPEPTIKDWINAAREPRVPLSRRPGPPGRPTRASSPQ